MKEFIMFRRTIAPALVVLGLILLLFGWLTDLQAQGKKLIKKGDAFPDVVLKAPSQAQDRKYLGISGDSFTIKDLPGEVFLVEIFDVYCIPCQNQAPLYKKLFNTIQGDPTTKDKIKMVGIAVGNDDSEVKIFRDHFKVPYAIVLDPDYILHKAVGGPPAPFAVIVQKGPGGKSALVAGTHLGFNKDMEGLLKELKSLLK